MQAIDWPVDIEPTTAHEGVHFICDQLLKDRQKFNFLTGKENSSKVMNSIMLSSKACLRSVKFYRKTEYFDKFLLKPQANLKNLGDILVIIHKQSL